MDVARQPFPLVQNSFHIPSFQLDIEQKNQDAENQSSEDD